MITKKGGLWEKKPISRCAVNRAELDTIEESGIDFLLIVQHDNGPESIYVLLVPTDAVPRIKEVLEAT